MTSKGKTVLITGGSSGIGLDAARGFLEDGANVVLNGRDEIKLAETAARLKANGNIVTVAGDVGDKSTGEKLVATAVEKFGSVDVLVNNAGIFGLKPFLDSTEEDLDRFISTNLKGTYFVTQSAVRQMKQQRGGSIVNVGTVQTMHSMAAIPASAAVTTKATLHTLTTSLASELAGDNIRINTIAPGIIRTPIYGDADVDAFGGVALLNRVGEVEEITDAIMYLANAEFTTGTTLAVDGGYVPGRA